MIYMPVRKKDCRTGFKILINKFVVNFLNFKFELSLLNSSSTAI